MWGTCTQAQVPLTASSQHGKQVWMMHLQSLVPSCYALLFWVQLYGHVQNRDGSFNFTCIFCFWNGAVCCFSFLDWSVPLLWKQGVGKDNSAFLFGCLFHECLDWTKMSFLEVWNSVTKNVGNLGFKATFWAFLGKMWQVAKTQGKCLGLYFYSILLL